MKTMITQKCDYGNRISGRGQKPNVNGRWLGPRASLTRTPLPGFVSYGGAGGARAVEQLRPVLAEGHIATVRNQVLLSMFTDF